MVKKDSVENETKQKPRWRYVDPSERKVKNPKKAIKDIFVYFKKYLWYFSIAVLCAVVSSILALIGPGYLSDMTNLIVAGLWSEIDIDWIINLWIINCYILILFNIFFGNDKSKK